MEALGSSGAFPIDVAVPVHLYPTGDIRCAAPDIEGAMAGEQILCGMMGCMNGYI